MATFYNQATLRYRGGLTNSNLTTGELTDAATLTKTAVSQSYQPGDTLTYVLSITNGSTTAMTDLEITDNLGAYTYETATVYPLTYVADSLLYYINGVPQATDTLPVTSDPTLTILGVSIPAGGNAMLIYEAAVTEYAPLGDTAAINNTAAVTGAAVDLTAEESVPMEGEPVLTITKSMEPQTLSGNERITYTFILQNAGAAAADATEEITVSDTFDPLLTDLTVALNGTPLTVVTDYSYSATTGVFETVAGVITVPAATYTQETSGAWVTTPGVAVLTVTGTIAPTVTEKTDG